MNQDGRNFTFNLSGIAHAVVDALRLALEVVMPDIMRDNNLLERNGHGQFRWNTIIAQLREKCQYLGQVDFNVCPRGALEDPGTFPFCIEEPHHLYDRGYLQNSAASKG